MYPPGSLPEENDAGGRARMHAFEMEPRLTVLALLLDALGVGADIETVDDRKRVQKAVYVAQRSGVDLGYRYSWYKRGPYSRALTRDYYELADSIEIGEHTNGDKLRPASLAKLRKLRPLFAAPQETGLAQADWLELVALVGFLRAVQR